MENNRDTQSDPLFALTHGAMTLSHAQYPAETQDDRLPHPSAPLVNRTHDPPLPSHGPSVHNNRLEAHPRLPTEATNGVPRKADIRGIDASMENGKLESQMASPFDPTDHAASQREDHASDRSHKQPKSAFQNTLENFTPMWFVICMNTGILGILMYLLPYQFNGLPVLSTIMYLVDLTLFVIVCVLTMLRWILYPRVAQRKTAASIDEISFLGAAPIAFLTLTALTALIVSNAYWGGHAWSLVAYVMWWFGMAWMLITCIGFCITLFRTNPVDDRSMTPSLFLPAVGVATAAFVGGEVVTYAYAISPRLAVPVIIVAYLLAGLAIWLSVILYSIFFHRLMASGWPEPAKRPSLMMLVGPFGQTSAAMQALGTAALTKMDFAGYHKGSFLQASAAPGVSSASIVFALLLLGHDIFWIFCCLVGVLEGAFRRQLSYNLTWWATIFPVGKKVSLPPNLPLFIHGKWKLIGSTPAATMTVSFLQLSITMDSPTFRVLTTAFLLLLLVDYFINWAFTLYYIFTSDLLFKKADKDMSDEEKQD